MKAQQGLSWVRELWGPSLGRWDWPPLGPEVAIPAEVKIRCYKPMGCTVTSQCVVLLPQHTHKLLLEMGSLARRWFAFCSRSFTPNSE